MSGDSSLPPDGTTDHTGPPNSGGDAECRRLLAEAGGLGQAIIGRFPVVRFIGSGASACVFETVQPKLDRPAALKWMRPFANPTVAEARRLQFLAEARLMAGLRSEHLVTIYEVGEHDSRPFLVLEYLHGLGLDEHLGLGSPLTPLEVARFGWQIATGLAAAHDREVIHRDVKPSNIWLELVAGSAADPHIRHRALVLDFGIALLVSAVDTPGRTIAGTPGYAAPEQVDGHEVPASDQFGLGCTLYRACTGHDAFPVDRGADVWAQFAVVNGPDPPPPTAVNARVPTYLSTAIMRLLEREPGRRFRRTADAAATLRECERRIRDTDPLSQFAASLLGMAPDHFRDNPAVGTAAAQALRLWVVTNLLRCVEILRERLESLPGEWDRLPELTAGRLKASAYQAIVDFRTATQPLDRVGRTNWAEFRDLCADIHALTNQFHRRVAAVLLPGAEILSADAHQINQVRVDLDEFRLGANEWEVRVIALAEHVRRELEWYLDHGTPGGR